MYAGPEPLAAIISQNTNPHAATVYVHALAPIHVSHVLVFHTGPQGTRHDPNGGPSQFAGGGLMSRIWFDRARRSRADVRASTRHPPPVHIMHRSKHNAARVEIGTNEYISTYPVIFSFAFLETGIQSTLGDVGRIQHSSSWSGRPVPRVTARYCSSIPACPGRPESAWHFS